MKIVAIIQARMASTRLPGKVMVDLGGKALLEQVVNRARQAQRVNQVVVATTDQPADDAVAHFCAGAGIPFFRGSENDVLDRFYQTARHFGADVVVRLTADCPLLDPKVIDLVIDAFVKVNGDYTSNTLQPTYPDGLDTEVFRFSALEKAWNEATLKSEREHVTPYLYKHPELFKLANVANDVDYSTLRWTVDEPADLLLARRIYALLGENQGSGMTEILALFANHPELKDINAEFERNEGYQKSLNEDTQVK